MNSTELSNLSYTNKDFNSIYSELLEYAKRLSPKWDPTASTESDPGVVLLKLAAIIGDKDNYNIDKNTLELMPASVTQLPAARQIFDQCGYSMHHYIAAEGDLSVQIVDKEGTNTDIYTIPRFTMFTDVDNSIVYTSMQPVTITNNSEAVNVVPVIEGTAVEYKILGDPIITLNHLDANNRLYFSETNIAENGIFITNVYENGSNNYDEWHKVDNIETTEINTRCFEFGLTLDGSSCYIEFPEDIDLLFEAGISITYITTSGSAGNVTAGQLSKLYTLTELTTDDGEKTLTVTDQNVIIQNVLNITSGKDPETIDDAYRAYKRVKNTFDTLVSTKDYADYIVTNKLASNAFVCDRTDDLQRTYKIANDSNNPEVYVELIGPEGSKQPSMNPFQLCIYALNYIDTTDTADVKTAYDNYNKSFTLIDNVVKDHDIISSFEDSKCLQHDFIGLEKNKILLVKNYFTINTVIIPKTKISGIEQFAIKDNVQKALFRVLQSKNIDFGEGPSYELIYDTIHNADPRIKAASVEYPKYQTYVVYKNTEGKFLEQRVDSNYTPTTDEETALVTDFRAQIFGRNVLAGVTPLYDVDSTFSYGVNQRDIVTYDGIKNITTETTITSTTSEKDLSQEFEVGNNESILLTCPSFIEDNSFSSYVKVVHNLQEVSANSKYTLKNNDFIMFFWKAADADEHYTYLKVTEASKANIICPSFTLNNTFDEAITKYFNGFSEESGTTNRPDTITVDNKTLSATEYIASLSNQKNKEVLTGTNIIKIYRSNTITVNDANDGCSLMYWLLNNEINQLFDSVVREENSTNYISTYTLQSGEYFYYTNKERTLLHILGEGTVITATSNSDSINWTAPREDLSHEQILTQGIEAIKNWQTITSGTAVITCQERKRVLLGPGTILKLEYESNADVIKELTSMTTPLNNCYIKYTDENNNTTSLEKIDGPEGWDVTTILNLNFSSTKPQVLTGAQKIFISDSEDLSGCYILGSHEVNKVGGKNIYVNDISGIKVYNDLQIFKYTHQQDPPDDSIKYASEGFTATIQLDESNSSKEIEFDALPGNYLLRITQIKTDAEEPDVNIGVKTEDSNGIEVDDVNRDICKLTVDKDHKIKLKIFSDNVTTVTDFVIHPLYKYEETTLTSLGLTVENIKSLDPYNNFDYTRTIEQPIKNPLISESFLSTKHAYNSYVISQWLIEDEDVSAIQVSNALR